MFRHIGGWCDVQSKHHHLLTWIVTVAHRNIPRVPKSTSSIIIEEQGGKWSDTYLARFMRLAVNLFPYHFPTRTRWLVLKIRRLLVDEMGMDRPWWMPCEIIMMQAALLWQWKSCGNYPNSHDSSAGSGTRVSFFYALIQVMRDRKAKVWRIALISAKDRWRCNRNLCRGVIDLSR